MVFIYEVPRYTLIRSTEKLKGAWLKVQQFESPTSLALIASLSRLAMDFLSTADEVFSRHWQH